VNQNRWSFLRWLACDRITSSNCPFCNHPKKRNRITEHEERHVCAFALCALFRRAGKRAVKGLTLKLWMGHGSTTPIVKSWILHTIVY
jgi:hypothetical protein